MMLFHPLILRFIAMFFVMVCAFVIKPAHFTIFVIAFGFSHYLMALVFSRAPIRSFLSSPYSGLKSLLLLLFGGAVFFIPGSLNLYFGLHHTSNELYLTIPKERSPLHTSFNLGIRLCLLILLYILATRNSVTLKVIPLPYATSLSIGLIGLFFALNSSWIKQLSLSMFLKHFAVDIVSVAWVVLSWMVPIQTFHLALFHFAYWFFYPIPSLMKKGIPALSRYTFSTLACIMMTMLFSPIMPMAYGVSLAFLMEQFKLWSFIHITSSFALSKAQPMWVQRLFINPSYA